MARKFGKPNTSLLCLPTLIHITKPLLHFETFSPKPSLNVLKALVVPGCAFYLPCHTSAPLQCLFVHIMCNLVTIRMLQAIWCKDMAILIKTQCPQSITCSRTLLWSSPLGWHLVWFFFWLLYPCPCIDSVEFSTLSTSYSPIGSG